MVGYNEDPVQRLEKKVPVAERVAQFLDLEGEGIGQETEQAQGSIITRDTMEYRKRLALFLEEEYKKIREDAEKEAAIIRNKAESKAYATLSQVQAEKQEIITKTQKLTRQMIEEAKRQQTIDRERIIAEAKKEAGKIMAEAEEQVAKLNKEATESAQKMVETECSRLLNEASIKAYDQSQIIISNSWQRAQQMFDAAEEAYNIVHAQLQNCIKAIVEADNKIEKIVLFDSESGPQDSVFDLANQCLELVAVT